jgi:hypothetical protein
MELVKQKEKRIRRFVQFSLETAGKALVDAERVLRSQLTVVAPWVPETARIEQCQRLVSEILSAVEQHMMKMEES